jgi:hypothetical protein
MNKVVINIYIILTNYYKFIYVAAKKRRVYETAVKIFRNGQLLTGGVFRHAAQKFKIIVGPCFVLFTY